MKRYILAFLILTKNGNYLFKFSFELRMGAAHNHNLYMCVCVCVYINIRSIDVFHNPFDENPRGL